MAPPVGRVAGKGRGGGKAAAVTLQDGQGMAFMLTPPHVWVSASCAYSSLPPPPAQLPSAATAAAASPKVLHREPRDAQLLNTPEGVDVVTNLAPKNP
jgi:hypothetical protein